MGPAEKRWIEAQFYFLCVSIYNKNCELKDVFLIMETIGTIYRTYSPTMAVYLAKQIITTIRYRPRRKETVLLAQHMGLSADKIARLTGYSRRQVFRIQKQDLYENMRFVPTFEDEHYKVMKEVLHTFDKLKELLII